MTDSRKIVAKKRAELSRQEREAAQRYRDAINRATSLFDSTMRRLEKKREQYEEWKDDPLVWVRAFHAGPTPQVFHTSEQCGWCPANADQILRGEAVQQGLRRCKSWECREQERFEDAA